MKVIRHSRIPFIITLLTLVFLYTPLVIVTIASFNASKYGGDWTHFTWKWYKQLFHEPDIWHSLATTLIIAIVSTAISTILGTLSALALHRSQSKLKAIYYALVHTPLVVPDILQGISLLLLFVTIFSVCSPLLKPLGIKLELGMTTIIIAHVTFCMSYVTMVVLERLHEFDNSLLEAAEDLGASGLYTFFHVTLPLILPGIIAGALFAFMLSFDDFVITFFVKGAGDTTLPVYIQSAIRHGKNTQVLNALSVVFLILTFIIVFAGQKLLTMKSEDKK